MNEHKKVTKNLALNIDIPRKYIKIIDTIEDIGRNRWSFEYNDETYKIIKSDDKYNIIGSDNEYITDIISIYDEVINMDTLASKSDLYVTEDYADLVISDIICLEANQSTYFVEIDDGTVIELTSYNVDLSEGCKYRIHGLDIDDDKSLNLYDTAVVKKIDDGFDTKETRTVERQYINNQSHICVGKELVNKEEIPVFQKTLGTKEDYILLDRTGFFEDDILTRDKLLNKLFKYSPKIYEVFMYDNYSFFDLFKNDYQSISIIDSLDEYDMVSVKCNIKTVEYNDPNSNKPFIEATSESGKHIVFWTDDYRIENGDTVIIVLGSVSEYDGDKQLSVGNNSMVVRQSDL